MTQLQPDGSPAGTSSTASPISAPMPAAEATLSAANANHGLKKNSLGVPAIVFYIIAAASPLTGVVAIVPIMIGIGNGAGTPSAFIIAAGILLLFAVGYLAMSRHVTNAGALYAYITMGLGRAVGLGSASVTVFAYSCIQFSLYGGFGYYLSSLIGRLTGVNVPWWACVLVAMIACLALGLRGAHAGGQILGVLITLECTMLLILCLGIIFHPASSHPAQITATPFSFPAVFAAGVGISIMFAQTTFIGFEGSAIYSEEAKEPKKTIPRATYFAVIFMAVVYALTSYFIIANLGDTNAKAIAAKQGGSLVFFVSNRSLGPWASDIFQVLIVTSIFAAIVTFHNNLSRYLYALGRQGLVWSKLGYTRKVQQTPYVAAITQTVSAAIIVALFAVLQLDPYTTLFTWLAGIGTVGIIAAQAVAAIAIFVFFRRNTVDKRVWHTVIAPILAIIGLLALFVIAASSVQLLLGTSGWLTALLIGLLVLSAVVGVGYALYLQRRSKDKYEAMTVLLTTSNPTV